MSVSQMAKVWTRDLRANEQTILLCMADFADDYGGSVYPSVALVAWKVGFSVRQVQRLLGDLREKGGLRIEREATRNHPRVYRLTLDNLPPKPPFSPNQKCSAALREDVIQRFAHTCEWCKGFGDDDNGPDGKAWHIDRLLPGSRGGKYRPDNVVLSCAACNLKRGAKIAPLQGCLSQGGVPYTTERGAIATAYDTSVEPSEDILAQARENEEEEGEPDMIGGKRERDLAISISIPHFSLLPDSLRNIGPDFLGPWLGFIADRKERKQPVTERAAKMLIRELAKRPEQAGSALEIAIKKGWRGLEWEWIDGLTRKPGQPQSRPAPARLPSSAAQKKLL